MKCISPLSLPRKGGTGATDRITVPCGKCAICKENYKREWIRRCELEERFSTSTHFLTLTYADEHLPINDCGFPSVKKIDVQLFLKRLRHEANRINEIYSLEGFDTIWRPLRYYMVAEYGGENQRPHYHYLMFNLPKHPTKNFGIWLSEIWGKGIVDAQEPEGGAIKYVMEYHTLKNKTGLEGSEPPFVLFSKGLGKEYLTPQMVEWHNNNNANYIPDGKKKPEWPGISAIKFSKKTKRKQ